MRFSKLKYLFFTLILVSITFSSINPIKADLDCLNIDPTKVTSAGDATNCANQLSELMKKYQIAQETNKKDLAGLQSQLNNLNQRILVLSKQLQILATNIAKREEDLAYTKKIFEEKIPFGDLQVMGEHLEQSRIGLDQV